MLTRASHRRGALTLLEVIIAISLMAVLLAALLAFFWQVIQIRDEATAQADRMQVARQVLSRMADELRGCVGFESLGFPIEQPIVEEEYLEVSDEFETPVEETAEEYVPLLIGDRRNITFLTTTLPAEHQYGFFSESVEPPAAQHDLTQISYWLWVDPEETDDDGEPIIGGIIRTEKKTLNQFLVELEDPLHVRNDLWSPELGYLEFRYFDGVDWYTTWDVRQGNSLPQMIQITVGFDAVTSDELENVDLDEYPLEEYPYGDDRPHPERYSIIVRMPAADKFFGSRIQKVGQQLTETIGGIEDF